MKKILNILILFLLIGVTTSCSDFLENEKYGAPTTESFWITEADALRAADALYFYNNYNGVIGRGTMYYNMCSDDMVVGRANSTCTSLKNFQLGAEISLDVRDFWPRMYQLIRIANDILLNIPQMNISQEIKDEVIGQAYFARGFAYMMLAPLYGDNGVNGGIPIMKEDTPFEELDMPRPASVRENYTMIIDDMKMAATLLPLLKDMSVDDYGRPHKMAAYAYIAKAALYDAQYDATQFQTVIEYSDMIIASGDHDLLPDYGEVFEIKNNYSKEYIYSFVSGWQEGSILPAVMFENKGWGIYNGWGYFTPTNNLVDAYEAGDVRLAHTVVQPGDEITLFGEKRIYHSQTSTSGMMFGKYYSVFEPDDAVGTILNPNGDYPSSNLNIPLVRYSDVLLWKAEALLAQGNSAAAGLPASNPDATLNKVRARAGLADIAAPTMDDLKQERRVEFAGELTSRHFDLVRWGDAQEAYKVELFGKAAMPKAGVTEVTSIDDLDIDDISVWAPRSFDPAVHHVFAIPQNEIAKSKNLKQNDGY